MYILLRKIKISRQESNIKYLKENALDLHCGFLNSGKQYRKKSFVSANIGFDQADMFYNFQLQL